MTDHLSGVQRVLHKVSFSQQVDFHISIFHLFDVSPQKCSNGEAR